MIDLLILAAIWGGSFLFTRVGAPEFGPWALAFLRVGGGALVLLPLLWRRHDGPALRQHWRGLVVVGLTNTALPFVFYGYATLTLSAGLASILNATTPLFGALIAWLWLRDRPSLPSIIGLVLGFAGVLWLAWDRVGISTDDPLRVGLALGACLLATAMYGYAACYTKKYLTGVPPMVLAGGSLLAGAVVLLVPALWTWPTSTPSSTAWSAAAALAIVCSGLAFVLYFRLVERIGPGQAIGVTFLIPAFGVFWGWLFLGEQVSATMLAACAVILLGTALTTGLLKLPSRAT